MQVPKAAENSMSKIQVDVELINTDNKNFNKQRKEKIQQNLVAYWLLNFITLLISLSFIPLFNSTVFLYFFVLCIIQSVLMIPLTIINYCKYTQTKWKFFRLLILLDGTTASFLIAMTGFIAINVIVMQGGIIQIYQGAVATILVCINQFLLIGNYRVVIAYCQWKKYQFIATKSCLLISKLCYLILATVFIVLGDPYGSEVIQQMQELIFIFVFGFLTLNQELHSKLSNMDGTSQFKFDDLNKQGINPQAIPLSQKIKQKKRNKIALKPIQQRHKRHNNRLHQIE